MAKASNKGNAIGSWAFLIGVILAVVFGLSSGGAINSNIVTLLAVIGLIIGLLNVSGNEVGPFLMSGAVLIIASAFGQDSIANAYITNTLQALLIIFVPATIIVALKNVFTIARN